MRQIDRKDLLAQLLPIVRAAGSAIMAIYRRGSAEVSHKADASTVTEADLAAHRVLATHLAHLLPGYQVVSEEDPMSLVYRQGAGCFWLIDPLDGIKEFIARNREFTVNIALIEKRRSALGVAYAPAKEGHACLVVASKSHLNEATQAMTDRLGDVSLVQAGSSLKFCRVAEGEADIYHRLAVSGTRRQPGRCWRGLRARSWIFMANSCCMANPMCSIPPSSPPAIQL